MDTPTHVLNECLLLSGGAGAGQGRGTDCGTERAQSLSPACQGVPSLSSSCRCLFHSLTSLYQHIWVFSPLGLSRVSNSNSFLGLSGKEYT